MIYTSVSSQSPVSTSFPSTALARVQFTLPTAASSAQIQCTALFIHPEILLASINPTFELTPSRMKVIASAPLSKQQLVLPVTSVLRSQVNTRYVIISVNASQLAQSNGCISLFSSSKIQDYYSFNTPSSSSPIYIAGFLQKLSTNHPVTQKVSIQDVIEPNQLKLSLPSFTLEEGWPVFTQFEGAFVCIGFYIGCNSRGAKATLLPVQLIQILPSLLQKEIQINEKVEQTIDKPFKLEGMQIIPNTLCRINYTTFAAVDSTNNLLILSIADQQQISIITSFRLDKSNCRSIITLDSSRLVLMFTTSMQIWNWQSLQMIQSVSTSTTLNAIVKINSKTIATSEESCIIRFWRSEGLTEMNKISIKEGRITTDLIAVADNKVAVGCTNGRILILDQSGVTINTIETSDRNRITGLGVAKQQLLVLIEGGNTMQIYNSRDFTFVKEIILRESISAFKVLYGSTFMGINKKNALLVNTATECQMNANRNNDQVVQYISGLLSLNESTYITVTGAANTLAVSLVASSSDDTTSEQEEFLLGDSLLNEIRNNPIRNIEVSAAVCLREKDQIINAKDIRILQLQKEIQLLKQQQQNTTYPIAPPELTKPQQSKPTSNNSNDRTTPSKSEVSRLQKIISSLESENARLWEENNRLSSGRYEETCRALRSELNDKTEAFFDLKNTFTQLLSMYVHKSELDLQAVNIEKDQLLSMLTTFSQQPIVIPSSASSQNLVQLKQQIESVTADIDALKSSIRNKTLASPLPKRQQPPTQSTYTSNVSPMQTKQFSEQRTTAAAAAVATPSVSNLHNLLSQKFSELTTEFTKSNIQFQPSSSQSSVSPFTPAKNISNGQHDYSFSQSQTKNATPLGPMTEQLSNGFMTSNIQFFGEQTNINDFIDKPLRINKCTIEIDVSPEEY